MYFQSSSVWVLYRINIKIIVFVGMFCASLGTDLYSPEMDKNVEVKSSIIVSLINERTFNNKIL